MSEQSLVPRPAPAVIEVEAEVEPNPGEQATRRPVVVVHQSTRRLTGLPAAIVLIAAGLVVLLIGLVLASIVHTASWALGYKARHSALTSGAGAGGWMGRRRG